MPLNRATARRSGVVLLVVLFFSLLLTASISTFVNRATIDTLIARNRDASSEAEAMARGAVRLAQALILQDRLHEDSGDGDPFDSHMDLWWGPALHTRDDTGVSMSLYIEDSGARLNLNALFEVDAGGERKPMDGADILLRALLEKIVDEMDLPPGEKLYDEREIADNLIDWIDSDDIRQRGGPEDAYYQAQDPRYRAANRPLLSVDELRLVEGIDGKLVEELEPYVTVYPFAPGGCATATVGCGVNLNTAPPHVLALLFYNDGVDLRLAKEDVVRKILRIRQDGGLICPEGASLEGCTPISEIVTNSILPPPTFSSEIFRVAVEIRVGDVRRNVVAFVDRSQNDSPRLLSWRAR